MYTHTYTYVYINLYLYAYCTYNTSAVVKYSQKAVDVTSLMVFMYICTFRCIHTHKRVYIYMNTYIYVCHRQQKCSS